MELKIIERISVRFNVLFTNKDYSMNISRGVIGQFGDEDFSDGQVKREKIHAQQKVLRNNFEILTDCSGTDG